MEVNKAKPPALASTRHQSASKLEMTYVIPKLGVRIVVQSDTNRRLTCERRMKALEEALDLDRLLQWGVRRFELEDKSKRTASRDRTLGQ